MVFTKLITAFAAIGATQAYLVTPPAGAEVFPGAVSDCSAWALGSAEFSCAEVEAEFGITSTEFYAWNPYVYLLSSACSMVPGYYYCVDVDNLTQTPYTLSTTPTPTPTSQPTSQVATTATPTSSGLTTPSPVQSGIISTCDAFYLVVSGDTCSAIATAEDISLDDFYTYNPAVGSSCASLWVGYYVCVGSSVAVSSSAIATTSTTSSATGISTPAPIQTGMTSTCDEFYLVVSGDSCAAIAADYGITFAEFYSMNPAVGSGCASLWVGDYVCVASSTTTSSVATTSAVATTTSTSGSGVTTPSPIQTGMVSTCDEFYFVVSGDTCAAIAADYGITFAQFYAWNPAVGSGCASLWVGDYVCVGVTA